MLQERRKRTLAPVEYNLVKLSEQQHQYSEPKHMGNLQTKKPKRKKSTAITPHSLASSTAHLAPTILQLPSATTPAPPFPPRWYTQQYMLFLALREAEGHPLTRGQVISRAIELNQEIAQKRGFPLLFKGKTPRNTCSRLLTENKQKLFVASRDPPESTITRFTLSYIPGNFQSAVEQYKGWMENLIQTEWPMFFSAKRIRKCKVEWQEMLRLERQYYSLSKRSPSVSTPTQTVQDVDASPSVRPPATSSPSAVPTTLAASSSSSSSSPPYASKAYYKMCAVRWKDYRRTGLAAFGIDIKSSESSTTKELITASSTCIVDLSSTSAPTSDSNSDDTPLKSSNSKKAAISPLDLYPPSDDEKDVELVFKQLPPPPKSLSDLLEVKTSSMENAGNGCFAKRYIPLHTLIGFYFGVPMSEDEFDLLKENVGIASQYTIRYKRTVLDATDDQGQPFAPNNPHFFCPMHFINESVHQVNVVFTEGPIVNQIWAVTIRDIEEGEELFTKYGDEIDRTSWTSG